MRVQKAAFRRNCTFNSDRPQYGISIMSRFLRFENISRFSDDLKSGTSQKENSGKYMNLVTGKGLIKVETEETRRLFHWYLELKFELLNDTYYSKNIISINRT